MSRLPERVLVLHQAVDPDANPDEADVLAQADAVATALRELGCHAAAAACTLDLERLRQVIVREQPDCVFNLVESLGGFDALAPLVADLLESLRIPFTGARGAALRLHNDKLCMKEQLVRAGLPTPPWLGGPLPLTWPQRMIVKPRSEHASQGIDDSSLCTAGSAAEAEQFVAQRTRACDLPCFAEAYIAGREFNLSLLHAESGVQVLPPAEIQFVGYPADKPQIVGYAAKWRADSFEYRQTPRRLDFPTSDSALLARLQVLAEQAFQVVGLAGYGRVDFRVCERGEPYVLEVNANPCLAPDAGFAAALQAAGVSFQRAVGCLLRAALHER